MLTRPRLAVDFRRRQPRGFISHAHMDHMARHELALATPETAALYRHRLGKGRTDARLRVREMPYGRAIDFGAARLTALPAGHCLGSAMLLAEVDGQRLLYTGDFKLGPSLTSAEADPPPADLLVMESTFGRPRYRLPPRAEVVERLIALVRQTLAEGKTPVVHAYALGKSQEVTKLLTTAGVPVVQHPAVFAISEVYAACGVELATGPAGVGPYTGTPPAGHAVVTLPRSQKRFRLSGLGPAVSIAVTGWAIDRRAHARLGVDHALPLSDHADFDQLLELVERVQPKTVYCTHGPAEFVEHLCGAGHDARPLAPDAQRRLF
ncbi:MAG: MBL fold metallo-hydrolase [Planctomycetota bacterium]